MRNPVVGPNSNCVLCPELVQSRQTYPYGLPTWGYGDKNSRVIFVGEAPGKFGCGRTGIAFDGDRSGDLFQDCLVSIGSSLESVYTTNIVKCCPPGNRTPTNEERTHCQSWFTTELSEVKAGLIVPLGATALNFFSPERKILASIGTAFGWRDRIIIPYAHPAYALRLGEIEEYKRGFKIIMETVKVFQLIYEAHSN